MKLIALSPIHIGCGEIYNGLSFIREMNKISVFETDRLLKTLGPKTALKSGEWISENVDIIEKLNEEKKKYANTKKQNEIKQRLQKQRRSFTLKSFLEKQGIPLTQIKDACIYTIACKARIYNDCEIYPFIKQINKPYIPGSEIKGAIRNALLYCYGCDHKEIQDFLKHAFQKMLDETIKIDKKTYTYAEILKEVKNKQKPSYKLKNKLVKRVSNIEKELQQRVFYIKPKDAKYDIMKFLQIGDSVLLDPEEVLAVSYAEPFNISRRFRIFYEYLIPNTEISLTEFKLETSIGKNEDVMSEKLGKMQCGKKQQGLIKDLNAILEACHRFSQDLIEEEIRFFEQHKQKGIISQLEEIASQNTPKNPVIRIGKDEGYLSITVGLGIKKLMPALYEDVLIHATKNKSYDSSHGGPLPKSRKLIAWEGREVTGGWMQLMADRQTAKSIQTTPSSKTNADLLKLQKKFKVRKLK